MTQLYHLANNPLSEAAVSRTPVGGAFIRSSDTEIHLVTTQTSFVQMFNAVGRQAILAIDAGTTYVLDTAEVGAGGLDEAVGNDRAYPVHIIASPDGQAVNLIGVRLGTAIADALPVGYQWFSAAVCPCLTTQAGALWQWVNTGDGWFHFVQDIDVMNNGAATPGPTAINFQNTPAAGAELIDASVKEWVLWCDAVNAAALQTLEISRLNLSATYTGIVTMQLANVAGYTQRDSIEIVGPVVSPTTGLAYGWGGGPTGGLDVHLRAVKY